MYCAQNECFDHQNMGVYVTKNLQVQLKGTSVTPYPILGENTYTKDYNKLKFVMKNAPSLVGSIYIPLISASQSSCYNDGSSKAIADTLLFLDSYSNSIPGDLAVI